MAAGTMMMLVHEGSHSLLEEIAIFDFGKEKRGVDVGIHNVQANTFGGFHKWGYPQMEGL